jgi:hypothetical protein
MALTPEQIAEVAEAAAHRMPTARPVVPALEAMLAQANISQDMVAYLLKQYIS